MFQVVHDLVVFIGPFQHNLPGYRDRHILEIFTHGGMTDAELISALRSSDQLLQSRAIDVLLKQIKPSLIHYVKQNSGSQEEGVTMANETVVALWEAVGRGRYQPQVGVKLSTWCNSVGRHLWLKELRRRKSRGVDNREGGRGNEPVEAITPVDIITAVEDHNLVSAEMQRAWRAFKKLGPDCQRLFRADLDELPEEEIMRSLSMTNLGSVKVKRHRCKAKWIELYKQEAPDPNDG